MDTWLTLYVLVLSPHSWSGSLLGAFYRGFDGSWYTLGKRNSPIRIQLTEPLPSVIFYLILVKATRNTLHTQR